MGWTLNASWMQANNWTHAICQMRNTSVSYHLKEGLADFYNVQQLIVNYEMCQCNRVYAGEMSDLLHTPSTRTTHFQPRMSHCSEQTAAEV